MIQQAIAILQQAGFDLTAQELAEILWLAVHLEESEKPEKRSPQPNIPNILKPDPPQTQTQEIPQSPSLPQIREPSFPVTLPSPVPPPAKTTETPIRIPAAVALRNSLALGRSLRPLMRKVPSPTENILDEEATVSCIAEEKIWIPVLKPAPQRWLELALVVEQSRSTAIWKQTITELQRLLKHHGAFRDVRTWELKVTETKAQLFPQNTTGAYSSTPHNPNVLIDPKGQRLILLVSDCISPAWRKKLIHPVLELWGSRGLISILQLLPERLWERTALSSETPVQLHSLKPGVFNSQLIVKNWDENNIETADERRWTQIEETLIRVHPRTLREAAQGASTSAVQNSIDKQWTQTEKTLIRVHPRSSAVQNSISIPVITLEPYPLLTWSRVIVGHGNIGTAGFKFSPSRETQQFTQDKQPQLTAPELVSRFRATASLLARRLAGLMAAAPVSLPVVQLIQQTQLPQSRQIHVAEVFMSGLLHLPQEDTNPNYIEYEFIQGIRELLLDSVPISKTTEVLEKVSEFIAKRVGLSVKDFEARLLTSQGEDSPENANIRPFARLKAQVLRRLGGVYADLAEKLDAANKTPADNNTPWTLEDYLINEPPRRQGRQEKERTPSVILHPEGSSAEEGTKFFEFDVLTVNAHGQEIKREKRQASYYTEQLGDSVTLEMVAIPGGKFMMGSPEGEGYESEKPQHEVTVQPFFMGKYPVTQAQWRVIAALPRVYRDLDPEQSRFKGNNLPVESVSWYDAVEFCARLSKKTGREYRLPSEAEWEYACRAGTKTPFHFGEKITDKLANYDANFTFADEPKGEAGKRTTPVGNFPPNAFGLYDMHGNIWEWCADAWHENYHGSPVDGSEWSNNDNQKEEGIGSRILNLWNMVRGNIETDINENDYRLVRGGSWSDYHDNCRSANRMRYSQGDDSNYDMGFRVVCVPSSRTLHSP